MAMSEVMGAQPVYEVGGTNQDGFGGNWIWLILFILLIGGGNGFGFGGGSNAVQGALTRADLNEGFAFNNIDRQLQNIGNGICDSTFALNNTMLQGFNSTNSGIADLGYRMQSCCCETNRNIDAVRYENEKNACAIMQNADANTNRIIDHMTQNEIQSLRDQLAAANLGLSNMAQTANIVAQVRPYPVQCVPFTPYNCNPCGTC